MEPSIEELERRARAKMLACLHELADMSFQDRVWVRGVGPEVSSFTEALCGLYDDSTLGDRLEEGTADGLVGPAAALQLESLLVQLKALPDLPDAELVELPEWADIRVAAASAAAEVRRFEDTLAE